VSAVDGAFAMTLFLLRAGSLAVGSAMLAAGLRLTMQRVAVVVLSLVTGGAPSATVRVADLLP
jgi:hypothetical protein